MSVCTLLARCTPSVRRAHTLPGLRVTGVLGMSAVAGCTAAVLVGIEATGTPVALLPGHTRDAETVAFWCAVIRQGAGTAVTGQAPEPRLQPIVAVQALVTPLSGHVWFALTESSFRVADGRKGALAMTFTGTAVLRGHCVPIETVSTPLTVGAVGVSKASKAFSGDGITAPRLQEVNVATAVTCDAGVSGHCWVSIVTVCTSLAPIPHVSWGTLVTHHFVPIIQVAGGAEIVGGCGERASAGLAVPGGPSGRQPVEAGQAALTVLPGGVVLACKANTMNITLSCMAVAFTGLTDSSEKYSVHAVIAGKTGLQKKDR